MAKSSRPARVAATMGVRFFLAVAIAIAGGGWDAPGVSVGAEKGAKTGPKTSAKKSKEEVAKPDEDDVPADDDGLETDEDLTALVVPSSIQAKAKAVDKMKFSQDLRGLLMEGISAEGDSLSAAKRHFEAAHRALADDPRAPYAYGISLLAHKNPKEALEQFQSASQHSPAPFLPALQGVVWIQILRNDYARGLPAILDFAHKIEETKGPWPTDHDRQHSAEWLGRMVGYLSGPAKQAEQAEAIEKLAGDIEKLLTRERKEAYEHGLKCVVARHEKMKTLATRPVEEVLAEAKQKRQELLAAAQEAEAEVKRMEDEIRDLKKPHDKQIADLNQELRAAATKHKRAAQDLAAASEEVDVYSTPQSYPQVRTGRNRVPIMTSRAENAQEKKARETQLASAKQRQQQSQSTLNQTKQQMTDIKSQREQAATEFRKAAAEKRPLIAEARKKSRDLTAHARDVDHLALTPEKIKSRVTALETYVPLDPETEKNHLLATLKPAG